MKAMALAAITLVSRMAMVTACTSAAPDIITFAMVVL